MELADESRTSEFQTGRLDLPGDGTTNPAVKPLDMDFTATATSSTDGVFDSRLDSNSATQPNLS